MREAYCEEKKQSKSSTTNMPLNLLMITTSPHSGSLQLAIKFFTGCELMMLLFGGGAGQVMCLCIQTCSICYLHWCLTHTDGICNVLIFLSLSLFLFTKMPTRSTNFTNSSLLGTVKMHKFFCVYLK